jgi:hypothetical protein
MRTKLRSKFTLLFVACAALLAIPAVALADELANVLDDGLDSQYEQMALETGGKTKETLIYVFPVREGDGNSGACNFTDNFPESPTGTDKATVTVNSNATSVATAKWKANNSTSINFTGCGRDEGRTLVVTSGSAASETSQTDSILPAEITFDSVNAFGKGTLQMNTARFRVVTSNPANTPPSVSVTGVQAGASYEKGSVPAAGCSVTDTEDTGESATPVFDRSGLDSNGLGPVQVSCSYTDGGGLTETASATYTIQDTGKPSSEHQLSPAANANGWHNQDVTVTLNGSDNQGGSGLNGIRYSTDGGVSYAAYDAANKPVISTEGTTTFKYYAVDNAGNQQAEQSFAVKLDKTAPSVSASVSPDAAASG